VNPFAQRLSDAGVMLEDSAHPEIAEMIKIGANEIERLESRISQLQAALAESREYKKHVQSHCEHDWQETLHGPDTVGEHCYICGVDRDYSDEEFE
jgi:prefoldin subunit 5